MSKEDALRRLFTAAHDLGDEVGMKIPRACVDCPHRQSDLGFEHSANTDSYRIRGKLLCEQGDCPKQTAILPGKKATYEAYVHPYDEPRLKDATIGFEHRIASLDLAELTPPVNPKALRQRLTEMIRRGAEDAVNRKRPVKGLSFDWRQSERLPDFATIQVAVVKAISRNIPLNSGEEVGMWG